MPSPRFVSSRPDRSQLSPHVRLGWLLSAALASVLGGGCDDTATTPGGNTDPIPEITLTLATPVPGANNKIVAGGVIQFSGSLKTTLGATVSKVEYSVPGSPPAAATVSGGNFSFSVDTATTHPAIDPKKCNKPLNVSINATGSGDATGSATVTVEVDNCAPTLILFEPPDAPGVPDPVFIGKMRVAGTLKETRVQSGRLELRPLDADGQVLTDQIVVLEEFTKAKSFDYEIDRTREDTADFQVVLSAVDLAGNTSEIMVGATILRQPSFLGNTDNGDQFGAEVRDATTYDWNGDNVLDEVVVGKDGLFLRLGQFVEVDGEGTKGTGLFQSIQDVWSKKAAFVAGVQLIAVERADLDGISILPTEDGTPARDDIVAIGNGPNGPAIFGFFAVRNVVTVKRSDGSSVEEIHHGFVLVDQHPLQEPPLSLAVARLNLDERVDVIVGSATENKGLTTVMALPEPQCTVGAATKPCSEYAENLDLHAKISKAAVFSVSEHRPEHKGVTQITSIAIGDFYQYDNLNQLDVCVGEAGRPYVSCYHNLKGTGELEQAQDSWFSPDTTDVNLILAAEWSNPESPDSLDLVVSSTKGIIRWLRGNGDGTFAFDPAKERWIVGIKPTSMVLADVGVVPGKPEPTPYIVAVSGGREGTVLPLYVDDNSHVTMCFRSWIFGGSVLRVLPGDFDNDGIVDLLAVDSAPSGTTFLRGTRDASGERDGGFVAPNVFHVCSKDRDSGVFGVREVKQVMVADFTSDNFPEVGVWGEFSGSVQTGKIGTGQAGWCDPLPGQTAIKYHPVWPLNLYMNLSGVTAPAPRGGEITPYKPGNKSDGAQGAGIIGDCIVGEKAFGNVTDLALGRIDEDTIPDLVLTRDDTAYTVGSGDSHPVCLDRCVWQEDNETDNLFGPDMPTEPAQVGNCCRYFRASDAEKTKPLIGWGAGAPLERASAMVVLAANASTPFNLSPQASTIKPSDITPVFSMAAGRNPKAVTLVDIDQDGKLDMATVMDAEGAPSADEYMEPRLRLFKGSVAKGKFEPSTQVGDVRKVFSQSGTFIGTAPVSYRVVEKGPIDLLSGLFGADSTPSVLSLSGLQGNTSVLTKAAGGVKLNLQKVYNVGGLPKAFALADLNQDNISDLFATVANAISFLAGNGTAFASKVNIAETGNALTSIAIADANRDGRVDVVTLDTQTSEVQLFLGSGKGGFAPYGGRLRVAAGAEEVMIGDSENDGCPDIYVRSILGATRLGNLACSQ
jgi:hypothetical protein